MVISKNIFPYRKRYKRVRQYDKIPKPLRRNDFFVVPTVRHTYDRYDTWR